MKTRTIGDARDQIKSRRAPTVIEVEGVSRLYGTSAALRDVSFAATRGEAVGILGPNGAGKSTLLRLLAFLEAPTQGRVGYDGAPTTEASALDRGRVGYLPEGAPVDPEATVEETLEFVARMRGARGDDVRRLAGREIDRWGLGDSRRRIAGALSQGTRQRLGLAGAFLGDPEWLILDEPTTGLDPLEIVRLRDVLRERPRGQGVVLSSHRLDEVSRVCDRVVVITDGRVVADGAVDELPLAGGDLETFVLEMIRGGAR